MRILLIGFMCSGKSRIGRELAALLGLSFHDLDRVIEQRVGAIKPFFDQRGEEAFREVEAEVLAELLSGDDAVIATGGGTPSVPDNLERMLQAGTVVWLDVPMDVLMPRIIRSGGDRPLLFGLKGEALRVQVETLLEPRLPIYERAHIRIEATGTPRSIAERIRELVTGR